MAETLTATETVDALDEKINGEQKKSDTRTKAAENKQKSSSDGKITNAQANNTSKNAADSLSANPILGMGADTVNQTIAGVSQGLVAGAASAVTGALAPLQGAVGNFFSGLATLSTISVEIAMELARNGGRALLKELDAKDIILNNLNTEITALHNACMVLANSQPFLSGYLNKLIQAYHLLITARTQFDGVARVLKTKQKFNKKSFQGGLANISAAKGLMLPEAGAINVRSATDFISSVVGRATNKDAVAAALSIPGISFQIGKLLIDYSAKTFEINNLIGNYMGALSQFIDAYSKSTSITDAGANHIASGVTQLDGLLQDMQPILFPAPALSSNLLYGTTVTTSGSFWALKLVTIEAWMKFTPVAALEQMDRTGSTVDAYNNSIAALKAIGDVKYSGGTNKVTEAAEDGFNTLDVMMPMLVQANTVIVRSVSSADVHAIFTRSRNHVKAMASTSNKIRAAITPFVHTPFSTIGPAKALVAAFLDMSNKLGLDRVARFISIGAVGSLFSTTPDTATSAGTAVAGLNGVITEAKADPNTSQQDIEKVTEVRDEFDREKTTKAIEASRSSADTEQEAIKREKAFIQKQKDLVASGKGAARRVDAAAASEPNLNDTTKKKVGDTVPNFNVNSSLIG